MHDLRELYAFLPKGRLWDGKIKNITAEGCICIDSRVMLDLFKKTAKRLDGDIKIPGIC